MLRRKSKAARIDASIANEAASGKARVTPSGGRRFDRAGTGGRAEAGARPLQPFRRNAAAWDFFVKY
jgi:hypothetical protein